MLEPKPLRELTIEDLGGGITLLDLGASGGIAPGWRPLARWVNAIGFDPNAEECARLNRQPAFYRSARFLPYAIAGETGPHTLYRTKSIYCWSLLKPRSDWLRRFAHGDLFTVTGTETIEARRLADVPELAGLDVDAMKIDTQGLELPILRGGPRQLESCLRLETETGFTQNYEGETTFDELLAYLEEQGFGLFGLNAGHAVARANAWRHVARGEQLLWCEGVWFRDFRRGSDDRRAQLTRPKALRALLLYAAHGCLAFGLEMAGVFRELDLITGAELDRLGRDRSWWRLPGESVGRRALRAGLDWMPRRLLGVLAGAIAEVRPTTHPLRRRS
jgi:FkbM family methyltransferase